MPIEIKEAAESEREADLSVTRGTITQQVMWLSGTPEQKWAKPLLLVLKSLRCCTGFTVTNVKPRQPGVFLEGACTLFNEELQPQLKQVIASLEETACRADSGGHRFSFTVVQTYKPSSRRLVA